MTLYSTVIGQELYKAYEICLKEARWYAKTFVARQSRAIDSSRIITTGETQEAQLSQRDRATLRVNEYFAKLLKVTQDHSKWHCWVGNVQLAISIPLKLCMSYRFWDTQRQRMAWPGTWGRRRSRSLKIALFNRPYTSFYWSVSVIVNRPIVLSCTVFLVIWRWIISWPWNLG